MSHPQRRNFYDMLCENQAKLLFITAELFVSTFLPLFLRKKYAMAIDMICIDEAHAASTFSSNCRPAYMMLGEAIRTIQRVQNTRKIRKSALDAKNQLLPSEIEVLYQNLIRVPARPKILLLTATANKSVGEEIMAEFGVHKHIPPEKIFMKNFDLRFRKVQNPNEDLLYIMKNDFKKRLPVLVFCGFKRLTETITNYLQQNGFKAFCFHGGLSELQKINTLKELDKVVKIDEKAQKDGEFGAI